jgi:hypothetical protein
MVVTGNKSQMGSMIVGLLMIVGGVIWTLGGFLGAPQALIVGGVAVAIVGGRRRTLRIASEKKKLSWTEPIAFGGGVKQQVTAVLDQVRNWARSNGVRYEA